MPGNLQNITVFMRSQAIKDWMLVLAVGLLLMIDFIILFTYTTVEGAGGNLNTERVANRENPEDITGVQINWFSIL